MEQRVDSERSSAWILGIVFFLLPASRPPRFLLRISFQTRPNVRRLLKVPHGLQRASAVLTSIPHIGYVTEIRRVAYACRPFSAERCIPPRFLAVQGVHNRQIFALQSNTHCSALSLLGIYVFSWGVYPFSIALPADPNQVSRASKRVGHAHLLGWGCTGWGSNVNVDLACVGDGDCLRYDWDDRLVPRSLCPLWLSDYVVVDCLDLLAREVYALVKRDEVRSSSQRISFASLSLTSFLPCSEKADACA